MRKTQDNFLKYINTKLRAPRYKRKSPQMWTIAARKVMKEEENKIKKLNYIFPTIEYEVNKKYKEFFDELKIRYKYESNDIIEPMVVLNTKQTVMCQKEFEKEYMFAFPRGTNDKLSGGVHMHLHFDVSTNDVRAKDINLVKKYIRKAFMAYPIFCKIGRFGKEIFLFSRSNRDVIMHEPGGLNCYSKIELSQINDNTPRQNSNIEEKFCCPIGYRMRGNGNDTNYTTLNSLEVRANNVIDLRIFGGYKVLIHASNLASENKKSMYKSVNNIIDKINSFSINQITTPEESLDILGYVYTDMYKETKNLQENTYSLKSIKKYVGVNIQAERFKEVISDIAQAEMDLFGTNYFQSYIDDILEVDLKTTKKTKKEIPAIQLQEQVS